MIYGSRSSEHNIKHWPRLWKLRIISAQNPKWEDLYDRLV
jgi:putative endonuclease